jgi:hypothetical protein
MYEDVIPVIQSWSGSIISPLGEISFIENKQFEFYNGSYSGSNIIATTQILFNNPFLRKYNVTTLDIPEEPWTDLLSKFENSDFDNLINNVSLSRLSTFNQDTDYDKNVYNPDNIDKILSGSAPKTSVPDSNYSSQRHILPRYLGSRLFSANYNFYTPPGNINPALPGIPQGVLPYFLNGDTGEWGGDISYGKTSCIDMYPRYFAHFKYTKENKEFWDTATYKIDALIECPHELIVGTIEEPKVLKIEDDNQRIYEVSNNFKYGRKVKVDFKSEIYDGIDYQTLETEPQTILQGGAKFQLLWGNELNKNNFVESCSFDRASWVITHTASYNDLKNIIDSNSGIQILPLTIKSNTDLNTNLLGKDYYLSTGSFSLFLEGGGIGTSFNINNNIPNQFIIWGPSLGLLHTYNTVLDRGIEFSNNNIGVPQNLPLNSPLNNPKDTNNYFRFNVTSSIVDLSSYEDYDLPFLIKRGDEIRVTWLDSPFPIPLYNSQTFVVTDVTGSNDLNKYSTVRLDTTQLSQTCTELYTLNNPNDYNTVVTLINQEFPNTPFNINNASQTIKNLIQGSDPQPCNWDSTPGYRFIQHQFTLVNNDQIQITKNYQLLTYFLNPNIIPLSTQNLFDKLTVWPNPEDFKIPEGKIQAFTIRRKVDADNSVVVFQIPPKNSNGYKTLSGQGFIIPNDFSPIQKDNVLTLINTLESKNAFESDK